MRAATPSAAGEIAVRELSGIYQTLDRLDEGLQYSISRYLMLQNAKIQNLSDSYIMKYPERFFTTIEQRLDHNIEKIATLSNSLTRQKWDKFAALVSNLEALNPLSVMMRGFCVLTDANNKTIINSVDQLNEGMNAMIRLIDGIATCNIISKEKGTGMKTKTIMEFLNLNLKRPWKS